MSEQAWLVREYLTGHTQRAIGEALGTSGASVNVQIRAFCDLYSGVKVAEIMAYDEARKVYLHNALMRYVGRGGVIMTPDGSDRITPQIPCWDVVWGQARYEHAWLLRCEDMPYREIGDRLGISHERARQMVIKYGRRVQKAMRFMRTRS